MTKSMRRTLFFSILAVALLLLQSCRSTMLTTADSGTSSDLLHPSMDKEKLVERVESQYLQFSSLRSSGRAVLTLKGKTYRMRVDFSLLRGQGIRLLAYPFPLVEAARVWINHEGLCVVDKINKVYSQISYEELESLLGITLSYQALESLFLAELFKADGTAISPLQLSLGRISSKQAQLSYFDAQDYRYQAIISQILRPQSFSIIEPSGEFSLSASYAQYEDVEQRGLVAKQLLLRLDEESKALFSLDLSLDRLRWNELRPEDLAIRISSNYQAVTSRSFFNSLK